MTDQDSLRLHINTLATDVHRIAIDHGWWDEPEWFHALQQESHWEHLHPKLQDAIRDAACRNNGENIALMHSELSEGLEGLRHGNPPSEHIPEFSAAEEEMADTIIRILDLAHKQKRDIGGALVAKIEFNRNRPYKHGGKKF